MVVKGLDEEAQSWLFLQVVWRRKRCFRLRLANLRQALSGLTVLCMPQWRLVAEFKLTRPFHSFGSLGRALVKLKNFLSLIVTVDHSSYILYVNRDVCAGVLEASRPKKSTKVR